MELFPHQAMNPNGISPMPDLLASWELCCLIRNGHTRQHQAMAASLASAQGGMG